MYGFIAAVFLQSGGLVTDSMQSFTHDFFRGGAYELWNFIYAVGSVLYK